MKPIAPGTVLVAGTHGGIKFIGSRVDRMCVFLGCVRTSGGMYEFMFLRTNGNIGFRSGTHPEMVDGWVSSRQLKSL